MSYKKRKNHEWSVVIKGGAVVTTTPAKFVNELERLCKKFSSKNDYYFKYDFEDW